MRWFFYLSIEISLKVTTLSKVTNLLELMTHPANFFCLDIGYLDSLAFLSLLIHAPNTLTYSKGFLGFLPSLSIKETGAKSANISGPWLSNTCDKAFFIRNAYVKGISTNSTCIANTYIEKAYTRGICISSTYAKKAWIVGAYIESVCIGGTCIVGLCARGFLVENDYIYAGGTCIRV